MKIVFCNLFPSQLKGEDLSRNGNFDKEQFITKNRQSLYVDLQ